MSVQDPEVMYRELQEMEFLHEIAQWVNRSRSLSEVAAAVLGKMAEQMDLLRCAISVLNRHTNEITIEAAWGLSAEQRGRGRYRLGEGITGLVVQSGRPAVVPRVSEEPLFLDRTGARRSGGSQAQADLSFICVPIRFASDTIGALSVDRTYSGDQVYAKDVRLLTIVALLLAHPARVRQARLERRSSATAADAAATAGQGAPAGGDSERPMDPVEVGVPDRVPAVGGPAAGQEEEVVGMEALLNAIEHDMISDALSTHHGNMAAAARQLGLTERMMGLRVHKYGIDLQQFKGPRSQP
jgi:transcriptional regulator with GAF, ATPase, and Fis domain